MLKKHIRTLSIAAVVFVVIEIAVNFSVLCAVLKYSASVTAPLIAGLFIAFVINIPMRILERIWNRMDKNISRRSHRILRRTVCLSLCFSGVFAAFIALVFIITPYVRSSVTTFTTALPEFLEKAEGIWERLSDTLSVYSIELPKISIEPEAVIATLTKLLSIESSSLIDTSINIITSAASMLFNTVVAIVISIYVLAKKEGLAIQAKRILRAFLPQRYSREILRICSLCANTFVRFLTGQMIEAIILGGLCFGGMIIFDFPLAPLISIIVGITALIPIFGAFIGIAIGAFLILLIDPIQALWFVVFIAVLQQIEGNIIYPRVVGRSVGLPALWVLIAVSVGSSFGIVGMFISVPVVSVIYCLIGQLVSSRLERKMTAEKQ